MRKPSGPRAVRAAVETDETQTMEQTRGLGQDDRAALTAEVTEAVTQRLAAMLPALVHELRSSLAPPAPPRPTPPPTADPMLAFVMQMWERSEARVDRLMDEREAGGGGDADAVMMALMQGMAASQAKPK